jgi:hypothetical protein
VRWVYLAFCGDPGMGRYLLHDNSTTGIARALGLALFFVAAACLFAGDFIAMLLPIRNEREVGSALTTWGFWTVVACVCVEALLVKSRRRAQ